MAVNYLYILSLFHVTLQKHTQQQIIMIIIVIATKIALTINSKF